MDNDAAAMVLPEPIQGLVADYDAALRRFLYARLPGDAVDDVAQDVWLSLWANRAVYEDRGRFAAYLRTLAARRVADWHRTRVDTQSVSDPEVPVWDPSPDVAERLLRRAGLAPNDLLWQRVMRDLSLPELAEGAGIPLGTVKSRLHADGRKLRRALDDWHRAMTADHECGGRLRADYLGVSPCRHCEAARALWDSYRRRATALDAFDASYVTVDSRLGLWLDSVGWFSPRPPDWGLNVSGPVELGRPRRLRNARGEDIAGGARVHRTGGRPWWAYPITPRDGGRLAVTHYVEPEAAEVLALMRRSRHGFVLTLYHEFDGAANGDRAELVQLPATVEVLGVSPAPDFVGVVHGLPTVMWRSRAASPGYPVIRTRWRPSR